MSAREAVGEPAEEKEHISLDDLKHRAEAVKDLAVSEAKEAASRVAEMDATRKALIVIGVAVAVVSVAYFLGTRAGRFTGED